MVGSQCHLEQMRSASFMDTYGAADSSCFAGVSVQEEPVAEPPAGTLSERFCSEFLLEAFQQEVEARLLQSAGSQQQQQQQQQPQQLQVALEGFNNFHVAGQDQWDPSDGAAAGPASGSWTGNGPSVASALLAQYPHNPSLISFGQGLAELAPRDFSRDGAGMLAGAAPDSSYSELHTLRSSLPPLAEQFRLPSGAYPSSGLPSPPLSVPTIAHPEAGGDAYAAASSGGSFAGYNDTHEPGEALSEIQALASLLMSDSTPEWDNVLDWAALAHRGPAAAAAESQGNVGMSCTPYASARSGENFPAPLAPAAPAGPPAAHLSRGPWSAPMPAFSTAQRSAMLAHIQGLDMSQSPGEGPAAEEALSPHSDLARAQARFQRHLAEMPGGSSPGDLWGAEPVDSSPSSSSGHHGPQPPPPPGYGTPSNGHLAGPPQSFWHEQIGAVQRASSQSPPSPAYYGAEGVSSWEPGVDIAGSSWGEAAAMPAAAPDSDADQILLATYLRGGGAGGAGAGAGAGGEARGGAGSSPKPSPPLLVDPWQAALLRRSSNLSPPSAHGSPACGAFGGVVPPPPQTGSGTSSPMAISGPSLGERLDLREGVALREAQHLDEARGAGGLTAAYESARANALSILRCVSLPALNFSPALFAAVPPPPPPPLPPRRVPESPRPLGRREGGGGEDTRACQESQGLLSQGASLPPKQEEQAGAPGRSSTSGFKARRASTVSEIFIPQRTAALVVSSPAAQGPSSSGKRGGFSPDYHFSEGPMDTSAERTEDFQAEVARDENIKQSRPRKGRRPAPTRIAEEESVDDHPCDGYVWKKYGQKNILNSPYPRCYYKCAHQGCPVKKTVNRKPTEPTKVRSVYLGGAHSHGPPSRSFLHGECFSPAAARQEGGGAGGGGGAASLSPSPRAPLLSPSSWMEEDEVLFTPGGDGASDELPTAGGEVGTERRQRGESPGELNLSASTPLGQTSPAVTGTSSPPGPRGGTASSAAHAGKADLALLSRCTSEPLSFVRTAHHFSSPVPGGILPTALAPPQRAQDAHVADRELPGSQLSSQRQVLFGALRTPGRRRRASANAMHPSSPAAPPPPPPPAADAPMSPAANRKRSPSSMHVPDGLEQQPVQLSKRSVGPTLSRARSAPDHFLLGEGRAFMSEMAKAGTGLEASSFPGGNIWQSLREMFPLVLPAPEASIGFDVTNNRQVASDLDCAGAPQTLQSCLSDRSIEYPGELAAQAHVGSLPSPDWGRSLSHPGWLVPKSVSSSEGSLSRIEAGLLEHALLGFFR